MPYKTDHLADIKARKVTKTNVIGLRKAINANERRVRGYSTGATCPKTTAAEVAELEAALRKFKPRVVGPLHETGLKLLSSPRYKKRLASVAKIIAHLESFHLIGFDRIGDHGLNVTPLYEARGAGKAFTFRNIPWQAGGNGPQLV